MIQVPSAVARTPVEIWVQIFEHLLDEQLLFNAHPFHPGCNYHTALREWRNYPRLLEISRQRAVLQLVSRGWKALANSCAKRFYAIPINLEDVDWAQLRPANRLYLDPERSSKQAYESAFGKKQYRRLTDHISDIGYANFNTAFATETFNASVLAMSNKTWDRLSASYRQMGISSNAQSLELFGFTLDFVTIPIVFPNLTFLNIQLDLNTEADFKQSLSLPHLTTLILASRAHGFFLVSDKWELPQLRHAELHDWYSRDSSPLVSFLHNPWPNLLSLKLKSKNRYISFPKELDVWHHLPRLEYLGLSYIVSTHEFCEPPKGHPLKTVASIGTDLASRVLITKVGDWKCLRVFASIHYWEDLSQPISESFGRLDPDWEHTDDDGRCERCIECIVFACEAKGVRYEDILGRSLDEYRAQVEDGRD